MRFWKKLILFIITVIAIILACSRYYIVKNNFLHSIANKNKQSTKEQIIEKYILESNIVKSIQAGEEITEKIIEKYLEEVYTYMNDSAELIAIYNERCELLYTNFEQFDNNDIVSILDKETDNYILRESDGKHYMLFSSHWTINNQTVYIVNIYDIEDIYIERDRQMKDILFTDILILVISFAVISIFSILVTAPIKELNKISKKIASGEFDQRVNRKSNDEIGELAESFNIMAEQIENKVNALNLSIKQKEDFINGFTHELKTPMTAIMGYADLLRLKKCDEELSRKALNYIYSEAKRLERLSFKLMKMMSISEEKIEFENIEIQNFIKRITMAENFTIVENIIETELERYYIVGDRELLEVVIRNLVENANKAEPKDNKILIKGEILKNEDYRISVIDKGRGIPQEHINRVTEDFYMVDKSRNRKNGGNGIGLSLVKKILELHHSNIHIESEKNRGTTVYFDLKKGEEKSE